MSRMSRGGGWGRRDRGRFWARIRQPSLLALSTTFTLGGSVLTKLSAVASALVVTTLLGADGYGSYAFFLATAALVAGIGQLGIQSVVTRDIARGKELGRSSAILAALAVTIAVTMLVSFLVCLSIWFGPEVLGLTELKRPVLVTLLPWATAMTTNTIVGAVLIGLTLYREAATVQSIRGVLVAAASTIGALSGEVQLTVLMTGLGEIVGALIALLVLRKNTEFSWDSVLFKSGVRDALRVGTRSGSASLLIQLATWAVSVLLIAQPNGLTQNGIFALALRLSLVVSLIPQALVTVLLPKMSKLEKGGSLREGVILPVLLAVLVAGLSLLGFPLLFLVLPVEFSENSVVMVTMLCVAVISVANAALGNRAVAAGQMRAWVLSDYALAATLLTCGVPLVQSHAALGLTLAHGFAYGASILVLLLGMRLNQRLPPKVDGS